MICRERYTLLIVAFKKMEGGHMAKICAGDAPFLRAKATGLADKQRAAAWFPAACYDVPGVLRMRALETGGVIRLSIAHEK